MVTLKVSFDSDIRRFRPEGPAPTWDGLLATLSSLFSFPSGTLFSVTLLTSLPDIPAPVALTPHRLQMIQSYWHTDIVLSLRISLSHTPPPAPQPIPPQSPNSFSSFGVPPPFAPFAVPPPFPAPSRFLAPSPFPAPSPSPAPPHIQPFPFPFPPHQGIPFSGPHIVPTASPSPHPKPAPKPAPAKPAVRLGAIDVPMKYRQIIWSLQDEYPLATEFRVMSLLIKFSNNIPFIRSTLNDLSRTNVLRQDTGNRGRPKRMPPHPLFFPRGFQRKVRTLVEAGFELNKVIDTLIAQGGSAEQASLQLLESAEERPENVYLHHRRAIEASVAHPHTRACETSDKDLPLDQRIVDSLLLLERTHGFNRNQIIKAAESLSGTPPPPPVVDSPARSRVLQSVSQNSASSLQLLSTMGFNDSMLNLFLLERHKGNIAAVIEELTNLK